MPTQTNDGYEGFPDQITSIQCYQFLQNEHTTANKIHNDTAMNVLNEKCIIALTN